MAERRTKARVEALEREILSVVHEDSPISIRHIFYRLTDPRLPEPVEKTEHGYKQVQRRIVHMRRAGLIPYGAISDATRRGYHVATYTNAAEAIRRWHGAYRGNLWANADVYLEVWCESRSIAGVIEDTCEDLAVSLYPAGGFTSLTLAHDAAIGINAETRDGDLPAYIVYIGDHDNARRNPTMRTAFEAYRLNRAVAVYSEVLVTVEAWQRVEGREVPLREGRPIVGLDLGAERSWSAAWALWRNGRSECYALCPGIPDLSERERQDAMPQGLYRKLQRDGALLVDEGLRVSRPSVLIDYLLGVGIIPAVICCDRFILGTLQDVVAGRWPVNPRVTRWSEATEDISGFRKLVADGPLSIAKECRALAAVSLSQATVASDDQGSVRLQKRRHGRSRDDVAVAGVLAAGALVRDLGGIALGGRLRLAAIPLRDREAQSDGDSEGGTRIALDGQLRLKGRAMPFRSGSPRVVSQAW